MRVSVTSLVLVAAIVACSSVFGGGGLDTSLVVQPTVVHPVDSFAATLTIRNSSDEAVTLRGNGCVAGITVYRSGQALQMQGADFVCTHILRYYDVPAQDSLMVEYSLVAALRRDGPPVTYDVPAPPGEYTLRTWGMAGQLPDLEVRFVVEN